MTSTRGILLPTSRVVSGDYDVTRGEGYMVKKEITVDGQPSELTIREGIWAAIEDAGDRPVFVKARKTYTGANWPFPGLISRFDVDYQAVHYAEGSILVTVAAIILYALPYLASILLVILGWRVVTYSILKIDAVGQWLDDHGPGVAAGLGAGVVLVAALVLFGGNKK